MSKTSFDREALRRTIAVINGKGGVGKTSITANLAGLFALAGHRVLAIDLDPQGNLGNDLGYYGKPEYDDAGKSFYESAQYGKAPAPLRNVRENLDVVVGGELIHNLVAVLGRQAAYDAGGAVVPLASSISAIAGGYDLVLIDCPPGEELLQMGALVSAHWVLIPTKTDSASRAGLREVARRFGQALSINPDLSLLGVVMFGVTSNARRILRQARKQLAGDLGTEADSILDATIRHVEASAVDARQRGQLVHELEQDAANQGKWYDRFKRGDKAEVEEMLASSAGALAGDYQRLAGEVLTRVVQAEAVAS